MYIGITVRWKKCVQVLWCVQKRCQTANEDEDNSDTAYDDLTQEEDDISNASAIDEEGVSQSNPACEDAESKCDSDVTAVRRRGKKRRVQRDSRSAATDNIGKLMSTYTDIVKQIAENRNTPQQRQEDKDWIFAKLIYQKMRQISEGVEKDDLQVGIQQLINNTRRRIVNSQQTGSAWSAANIPQHQCTSSAVRQQPPTYLYIQGAEVQQHPTFSSIGAATKL